MEVDDYTIRQTGTLVLLSTVGHKLGNALYIPLSLFSSTYRGMEANHFQIVFCETMLQDLTRD